MKKLLPLIFLMLTMSTNAQNHHNRTIMRDFVIGSDTYCSVMKKVSHIRDRKEYNKKIDRLTILNYKYENMCGDIEFYFTHKKLYMVSFNPDINVDNSKILKTLYTLYGKPYESEKGYNYRWVNNSIEVEFTPFQGIFYYDKELWNKNYK